MGGSDSPKYMVLGTVDRRVRRRGLGGRVSLEDVAQQMADFKTYLHVDLALDVVTVEPSAWTAKMVQEAA